MKNIWRQSLHSVTILAVVMIMFSTLVRADGETREATQAEKDFAKSTLDAVIKALPPGPEGWEKDDEHSKVNYYERVDVGAEKAPLRLEYNIVWKNYKGIDAAEQKKSEEMRKIAEGPMDEKAMQKIKSMDEKMAPHDVDLEVSVTANDMFNISLENARKLAPVGGGIAYQTPGSFDEHSGWSEANTCVFLGKNWKAAQKGKFVELNFTPAKGVPHTVLQDISMCVKADPDRAQKYLAKVDWAALNKLLK